MNRQIDKRFSRLKTAVERAGGNEVISELSKVSKTTLSGYMNGNEWKLGHADRIATACKVSLQWLLFGDGPEETKITADRDIEKFNASNNVSIPQYTGNASAGNGSYAANVDSYAVINIGRDVLPPIVLSRLSSLVAVTVRGDSMIPSLYDCDTIFVDTKDCEIITGAVYVLRRDTDLLVKRLSWSVTGDLIVSSDNPLYKPEQISAVKARQLFEDGGFPIAIVGRVIWRMGIMGAR